MRGYTKKTSSILILVVLAATTVLSFQNCARDKALWSTSVSCSPDANGVITEDTYMSCRSGYEQKVTRMMNTRCSECHTGFTSIDVLKGYVVSGDPDNSKLYRVLTGSPGVPDMRANASDEDRDSVKNWINFLKDPSLPEVSFQEKVLPILQANCVSCHGDHTVSTLDLRSRDVILKQGLILDGNVEDGLLIEAASKISTSTSSSHLDYSKSPAVSKAHLSVEDLNTIKNWILSGTAP